MGDSVKYAEEIAANRANRDARAVVHSQSAHYDLERYIRNKDAISSVVE